MTVVIDGMVVTCCVDEFMQIRDMLKGSITTAGDKTSPSVHEDLIINDGPLIGAPGVGVAVGIADDPCVTLTEGHTGDSTTIFPRTKARKRLD